MLAKINFNFPISTFPGSQIHVEDAFYYKSMPEVYVLRRRANNPWSELLKIGTIILDYECLAWLF